MLLLFCLASKFSCYSKEGNEAWAKINPLDVIDLARDYSQFRTDGFILCSSLMDDRFYRNFKRIRGNCAGRDEDVSTLL